VAPLQVLAGEEVSVALYDGRFEPEMEEVTKVD
jgi:hypothetical protein